MKIRNKWGITGLLTAIFTLSMTAVARAEDAINTGDTAWVIMSAALVLLMTPALAFFYGGLVRKKNMLSVLMQCFIVACLITIQWVVIGYTLSFGTDIKGFIGGLNYAFLKGVNGDPWPATAIPPPSSISSATPGSWPSWRRSGR